MKDRIVYRKRLELKIITIVIAIIWLILYALILIGDLCVQSPHFWHNQKCLLIILIVFCIPILIIGRFQIIFDYKNRQITHIPYFKPKRRYAFDDVYVTIERGKPADIWDFTFEKANKQMFHISSDDFETQTRECDDYLKEFLQGESKFVYDLERSISQEGYQFTVYHYFLSDEIGSVSSGTGDPWITVAFDTNSEIFTVRVLQCEIDKKAGYLEHVIAKHTFSTDGLIQSVLELARHYLR